MGTQLRCCTSLLETYFSRISNLPAVNVIQYSICLCPAMRYNKVLPNPGDEVVLEGAFNELMEEVG